MKGEKMKRVAFAVLCLMSVISGCGTGNDSVPNTNTGTGSSVGSTAINSYTLEGTTDPQGGIIPINSIVNAGAFTVSWDIASSDPYNVAFRVSKDAVISDDDIQFFTQNCGSLSIYKCNKLGSFSCRFTTEKRIYCGDPPPSNGGSNFEFYLEPPPPELFMIIKACNGLFSSCQIITNKIQLL
jgi:hypothetical protein